MKRVLHTVVAGILVAAFSLILCGPPGRVAASAGQNAADSRESGDSARTYMARVRIEPITEKHWRLALNESYFHGKLEVRMWASTVDIEASQCVVEVTTASNYARGVSDVLRYAEHTDKKPVLALYIDGESGGYESLLQAAKLCEEKGVRFMLANCYVSVDDLVHAMIASQPPGPITRE